MAVNRAYIGIGSNLDDPETRVRNGIAALRALGEVSAVSSLYRTEPWGKLDQPPFINAAVALDTQLRPRELLNALKALERELGRRDSDERWGPRRIDFDILLYGDLTVDEGDLVIPHRRLYQRAFVLVPLAEIAPDYAPMRDRLAPEDLAGVVALRRRV